MIHIIIWVVMFLVWYLYRTYKASVEENEEVYQASESTTVNDNKAEKEMNVGMMDEYSASYYIISSHTQKHFAGSSRIWFERLKVISLPRELVVALY